MTIFSQIYGYENNIEICRTLHSENLHDRESNNVDNVNCQICFNGGTSNENIVNLYNKQKENNDNHWKK